MRKSIFLLCLSILLLTNGYSSMPSEPDEYEKTLQDFVDLRFGMFICYNIMSYGASWGEANFDISTFNPKKLDCNQWAKAAKTANMKFGLLTTKHHEGFCLWDSKVTEYDVASTPYKKDIVEQYVEAFRKSGLKVGLYYSIWDSTHDIDKGEIGSEELDFIKTQIRELLTNYGKIDYFVIDGWFWRMGHHEVPYIEIRELIRDLQPNCLITDHTHLQAPYHVDIPYFEGPFGAFPTEDNKMPSALGHCSFNGNGWFWSEETTKGIKEGESAEELVKKLKILEARYCNFMLNCMPNRNGLLEEPFINLLKEIGEVWQANFQRPNLIFGEKRLIYSAPIVNTSATSGISEYLIDAQQYGVEYKDWISDGSKTQTIVLDLGATYNNINVIDIVPNHRCKPAPETALKEGNLLQVNTFISNDNINFKKVADNEWIANEKYRTIVIPQTSARYIKLEILDFYGTNAIIAEIDVGSSIQAPKQRKQNNQ